MTWDDGASHGRNVVTRTHKGNVVTETFDGRPGIDFTGSSVSVYSAARDIWLQTWVDDESNYFALEGRFANGEMTLLCDRNSGPAEVVYRMRFTEIEPDSLTWR